MRKSQELFTLMMDRGYPEQFSKLVAESLSTDFTAEMMIRYFSHFEQTPSMERVADEMLSILSLRDGIADKKINEYYNKKWNEFLWLQKNDLL